MSRIQSLGILALSAALLAACADESQNQHARPNHNTQYGYRGDQDTTDEGPASTERHPQDHQVSDTSPQVNVPAAPKPTPPPGVTDVHQTNPGNNASAAPSTPVSLPYGKPVPGKPGYVTSPYSSSGYVDVRGFPPGTEVKDPYTQKVFLVP